jgi:hypothetical protein
MFGLAHLFKISLTTTEHRTPYTAILYLFSPSKRQRSGLMTTVGLSGLTRLFRGRAYTYLSLPYLSYVRVNYQSRPSLIHTIPYSSQYACCPQQAPFYSQSHCYSHSRSSRPPLPSHKLESHRQAHVALAQMTSRLLHRRLRGRSPPSRRAE